MPLPESLTQSVFIFSRKLMICIKRVSASFRRVPEKLEI